MKITIMAECLIWGSSPPKTAEAVATFEADVDWVPVKPCPPIEQGIPVNILEIVMDDGQRLFRQEWREIQTIVMDDGDKVFSARVDRSSKDRNA
jgi:hypothetical protein